MKCGMCIPECTVTSLWNFVAPAVKQHRRFEEEKQLFSIVSRVYVMTTCHGAREYSSKVQLHCSVLVVHFIQGAVTLQCTTCYLCSCSIPPVKHMCCPLFFIFVQNWRNRKAMHRKRRLQCTAWHSIVQVCVVESQHSSNTMVYDGSFHVPSVL